MLAYPTYADELDASAASDSAKAWVVDRRDIKLYGRNREYYDLITPEKILYGPADTGKTITNLQWIHEMCSDCEGLNVMICRAYYTDIAPSVFESYINKILPFHPDDPDCQVRVYGGLNMPQKSIYPNGSVIHWVGLDKPGKALSTERDIIYVNECNQIPESTWNVLMTRANGRAGNWIDENGDVQSMLMGDMNPGLPTDWPESRASLEVLHSRHLDNPDLYDQETGEPTAAGQRRLDTLARLTGPERDRLFLGKPVFASGLSFYAWHPAENVSNDADFIPGAGPVVWGCDDGYTGSINPATGYYNPGSHPRVILLAQIRGGRLFVFREHHSVDTLMKTDIDAALDLRHTDGKKYPRPAWAACESAPEMIKQLNQRGIATYSKPQSVIHSLRTANEYIGADDNGIRRVMAHGRLKHLAMEMVTNQIRPDGRPTKDFDNFLDALRYLVWRFRDQRG